MMDAPAPGFDFHHIGVACRSLATEQRGWAMLGYEPEGETFVDPLQGVTGLFLTGPGPRMELVAPLDGSTTLKPFIDAGIKMYHHAYMVSDIEAAAATLTARRAKTVSPPKPAVAFGGRPVMFLMLPTTLIVELIQS